MTYLDLVVYFFIGLEGGRWTFLKRGKKVYPPKEINSLLYFMSWRAREVDSEACSLCVCLLYMESCVSSVFTNNAVTMEDLIRDKHRAGLKYHSINLPFAKSISLLCSVLRPRI